MLRIQFKAKVLFLQNESNIIRLKNLVMIDLLNLQKLGTIFLASYQLNIKKTKLPNTRQPQIIKTRKSGRYLKSGIIKYNGKHLDKDVNLHACVKVWD